MMMVARVVFLGAAFFGFELMFLSYIVFLHHPYVAPDSSDSLYVKWASSSEANCSRPNHTSGTTQPQKIVNITRNDDGVDIWFSTYLLILLPVRPQGIHSRQLIRDTWFKGFQNRIKDVALRFVVGNKSMESDKRFELTEENGTFGDIIFVDTVENDAAALTNKTLGLISWAHHHVKFSYWMKCDDDTYVFVQNVLDELRKRPTTTKLYFGKILVNSPIVRGNYKWSDNEWNLSPVYLPFAMGGGYIISHDLVAAVSENSLRLKWHVNEDTAVGAWLSAFDYERRSDDRFCFWWKGHSLDQCKQPFLALLLFGFNRDELILHFNHYHEQVSSNASVTLLTAPPGAPTAPPTTEPTTESTKESTTESTNESTAESTKESTAKSTESTTDSTKESKESTTGSVTKPTKSGSNNQKNSQKSDVTKKATKKPSPKKNPTTKSVR